ncbi:tripartite tricarboxylate transporter TctB family protein [Hominifimenecus sp. rT4P-3]|uniref:tripartite tricarboxylate transporter TctB family protein n=1 Tax=Hominifimenecus sp. rT4P-3 TaxID=3242979 RepID=UPI003DA2AEB9
MIPLMQRLAMPVIVMAWATYYFIEISGKPASAQHLIRPVYLVMLLLFVINTIRDVKRWKREREKTRETDGEAARSMRNVLVCLAGAASYLLLMKLVGFLISSAVFLFVSFLYLKVEKKWWAAVLAVVVSASLYAVFQMLLGVPLPKGIF